MRKTYGYIVLQADGVAATGVVWTTRQRAQAELRQMASKNGGGTYHIERDYYLPPPLMCKN